MDYNNTSGAVGEMAFAKYRNVYYYPTFSSMNCNDRRDTPDVDGFQVRTKSLPHHCLIVRDYDKDDDIFVSMMCSVPETIQEMDVHICGWIMAKDAKKFLWLRNPHGDGPAYFVPQEHLHSMSELP